MSLHGQECGDLKFRGVAAESVVKLAVVIAPTLPGPPAAGAVIATNGYSQMTLT